MSGWKFYFPDDGETAEDAIEVREQVADAEMAADSACEYDLSAREGYLHVDTPFHVAVIDPDGNETRWLCEHEATIISHVSEAEYGTA